MRRFALLSVMALAVALAGCTTFEGWGDKQKVGAASGAVIGGVLGSRVGDGSGQRWATGVGVLLGALMGSEIGTSLDKADMLYAEKANGKAHEAPIGETITWNNPESGNYGSVTPKRDGYSTQGRYCREYQQTIVVGGQEQQGYGTACRNEDGSWEIVNNQ